MRFIPRDSLPRHVERHLARRQATVDERLPMPGDRIDAAWRASRQSGYLRSAEEALKRMAGPRQRCMYCVDSQASDIEHFRPKSRYPELMFAWRNLLLVCTPCGRYKGHQFPMLRHRRPALLDPTQDDPWLHLSFDPRLLTITARILVPGGPSQRGEATVALLRLDRREGLQEGYRRTYRRLLRLADDALAPDSASDDVLFNLFLEGDEHGLLGWCTGDEGVRENAFDRLSRFRPDLWQRLCGAVRVT